MDRLKDKVCIVTAAGQGIGRASALAMFEEGAHVVATDINAEALEELKGHGLETALLDVRDAAAIAAFRDRVGGADVLFNCAGFVDHGTILECDEAKWAFSFDLNVTAMYRMIRAFLPGMIAKGSGSIVNMASVAGSIVAVPNRFVYGASKAAVIGLTKSVAADFVTTGHSLQLHLPGHGGEPLARRADARAGRLRDGAQGLRGAPAHGADRPGRGDRGARGLSGLRRIHLYHRRRARDRRRPVQCLNFREKPYEIAAFRAGRP